MYKRIVVPLDGSKLAESVLPHVEELARGCGGEEILLVSVTERISGQTVYSQRAQPATSFPIGTPVSSSQAITQIPVAIGKKQRQAQRYLERIGKKLLGKKVKTGTKKVDVGVKVLLGNPAEEIVLFTEENDCDLIAMTSHGRSGLSRWAYGSVADKILRSSPVPVLIVKATEEAAKK